MQHVEQQTEFECGVAVLQMVTGRSRDFIRAALPHDPDDTVIGRPIALGVSEFDMVTMLLKLDFIPVSIRSKLWLQRYYDVDGNFGLNQRPLVMDQSALLHLVYGRDAIVHTRSMMGGEDVHHWMAWDKERHELLDPATSIYPFKKWFDVEVVGVILLFKSGEVH